MLTLKRKSRPKSRRVPPACGIEPLENRMLLSAALAAGAKPSKPPSPTSEYRLLDLGSERTAYAMNDAGRVLIRDFTAANQGYYPALPVDADGDGWPESWSIQTDARLKGMTHELTDTRMNASGMVIGNDSSQSPAVRGGGSFWNASGDPIELGFLPGTNSISVYGLNDLGWVAGACNRTVDGLPQAFVIVPQNIDDDPDLEWYRPVAGPDANGDGSPDSYSNGLMQYLGQGSARAIDNDGRVFGGQRSWDNIDNWVVLPDPAASGQYAFATTRTMGPYYGSCTPYAVNVSPIDVTGDGKADHVGTVVGIMATNIMQQYTQVTYAGMIHPQDLNGDFMPDRWFSDANQDGVNDLLVNLGALKGQQAVAYDVNSSGVVVGKSATALITKVNYIPYDHAVVSKNGVLMDLNSLIGVAGWNLTRAVAVTEAGWIAASGTGHDRKGHPVVLLPNPPAAASTTSAPAAGTASRTGLEQQDTSAEFRISPAVASAPASACTAGVFSQKAILSGMAEWLCEAPCLLA